ncbi:hypothetical protein SAMN04488063_1288 [Halopelagius inordinatus]|uniref:DUF2110 domain-containing protein n=1 Tax=Halopelagius inordinatus TaxID=553467 RepID=A0A1I2NNY2_9EURY|nr:DUF2110 family protein [Halopelagius inordinatus]SFG05705.1 hypothetical protein SAMN04488063_1288 [Halopelagius inordinatus]
MVVIATKCYVSGDAQERALDSLDSLVRNDIGELDVEWDIGVRDDDFVSVTVTGDDATIARNLLADEWGEVTPHLSEGETHVGTLESWDDDGFVLDAGYGNEVRVSTDELGLGTGTATQIRDRFGIVQHVPLQFVYGETPRLADEARNRLFNWTREETGGRVNVNSSTRGEVRATVNRAGHAEDIVTVERLGLLEQSIVCAEGTDPPGLLASIGSYLPAELKCVIS